MHLLIYANVNSSDVMACDLCLIAGMVVPVQVKYNGLEGSSLGAINSELASIDLSNVSCACGDYSLFGSKVFRMDS